MTAKEWLMRARRMERRVKALEESKRRAYDRCISATAAPSDTPGCGGGNTSFRNKNESYAILSDEVDRQLDELNRVRTEILHAIRGVEDAVLATILIEYYINGKTWEQIAVDLGYAYRHITRLHGQALKKVKDVLLCPTQFVL